MKKAISVLFVFLCLFCVFFPPVFAQEKKQPQVIELNIKINPADYKALTGSAEKKKYNVSVKEAQSDYVNASINIRGNSSRMIGLETSTKRIPFELTFSKGTSISDDISNHDVKFINSLTPYRLIAEYLALDMFAEFGIPTPAHSFVFLRFNDVDFGLYIAVEDVNKAFLSKWYEKPLNAAYKATNNAEKESEFIDSTWFGHLFEKVSGSQNHLSALIDSLDRGEDYEQYINIDEWLRFFACVAVMGGDGSIFTEQNNYVLYDNSGKFDLIPWDLSEAFSGRRLPSNIDHYYIWHNLNDSNPLFDLLMCNDSYKEQYHSYIKELVDQFLDPVVLQERYDAILEALTPYFPLDHSILLNSEDTLSELRSDSPDSPLNLRYILNAYYLNLNAQLEGREDSFIVNEQFADYYDAGNSFDSFLPKIESESPLLDTSLPKKIVNQQTDSKQQSLYWGLGIVAAVICVIAYFIFIKRKKSNNVTKMSFSQRIKRILVSHKAMLFFFLFIILYECIVVWQFKDWEVGAYPYVYHALDYSFGFCTRVLPGAVSNILLGEVTVFKVTVLETVLLLLVFGCLSWFLEKLYLRFDASDRPYGLLLIFLFVTGPCTFSIYVKELGMLDAWLLYCAVAVFLVLLKKKLWPLIVIFAFAMIMVYYASILSFAPFIVIILLYKAVVEEEPKNRRRLYIIAFTFAVVAIGFTVYFMSFERSNIRLTPEEFFSLLNSRGCTDDAEVYNVLYGVIPDVYQVSENTQSEIVYQLISRIHVHLTILASRPTRRYIEPVCAFLLICPVLFQMLSFFRYKMKNSKQRMQKFVFFCMLMLFFFVNVTCFFVSTDSQKWLAHSFMLTFVCFLVVLYNEPQMMSERIKPMMQKIPFSVWVCYCMLYAVMVFPPYS